MIPISLLNGEKMMSTATTTPVIIKHEQLKMGDVFADAKLVSVECSDNVDDNVSTSYSEYSEDDTYTDTYTIEDSDDYDDEDQDDNENEDQDDSSEYDSDDYSSTDDELLNLEVKQQNINNNINNINEIEIEMENETEIQVKSDVIESEEDLMLDIAAALHSLVQNHFQLLSSGFKHGLFGGDIFMEHLEILFFSYDLAKKYYDLVDAMPADDIPSPSATQTRLYMLKKTVDIVEKVNIYRSFVLDQLESEETTSEEDEDSSYPLGDIGNIDVDEAIQSKLVSVEQLKEKEKENEISAAEEPSDGIPSFQDLKFQLQMMLDSPDSSFSDLGQALSFDISDLSSLNEKLESITITSEDTLASVLLSNITDNSESDYSDSEDYSSSESSYSSSDYSGSDSYSESDSYSDSESESESDSED